MDRFFDALGLFVVRFRYPVVLAWIVLVVIASRVLPSLGSEVNNDNSQFLPSTAPSSQAADLAAPIFGNPNTTSDITVVAAVSNGKLDTADQAAIAREAVLLRRVPRIESVRIGGISSDGGAAELVADVHVNQADITRQKTIVADVISTFHETRAPSGLALNVAGSIATNVANQASSNKTGNRTQSFTFLFIVVLLLLVFRSVLAPIITLLPPAFALLVSDRFIGGLGAHGLKISEITQLLLIVLLIGAGTDYGLFLVFRVREEIRRGMGAHDAVRHALVRVGESISASAGTVIFALLSLLFASFGIYHDLGIPLALGIAVMLLAGLTLLPALLSIFGKAAFWPSRLDAGSDRVGVWGRVASRLVQRPAITLASGVVIFGALAAALVGYHSGGFGGALERAQRFERGKGQRPGRKTLPAGQHESCEPRLSLSGADLEHPAVRRDRVFGAAFFRSVHTVRGTLQSERNNAHRERVPASPRGARTTFVAAGDFRSCRWRDQGDVRRVPRVTAFRVEERADDPVRGDAPRRCAADDSGVECDSGDSLPRRLGCAPLRRDRKWSRG